MIKQVGRVAELVRYPVKSMAGIAASSAVLGWHGLAGDRRFALRRVRDNGGFPWLSASSLPELILYRPCGLDETSGEPLPTHVRTPSGEELPLGAPELLQELSSRLGSELELMRMKHGVFDDAAVSVISRTTIAGVGRAAGIELDRRRFRANILIEAEAQETFHEDAWVGGRLIFGEGEPRACVAVIARDLRCMMINLDPNTAAQDARVMKAAVQLNQNCAGVYGTVVGVGTIRVGDPVSLISDL
ncbi:MAG: MOSC domain-containing protein [Candidatus Eisenbacteria bacterium]